MNLLLIHLLYFSERKKDDCGNIFKHLLPNCLQNLMLNNNFLPLCLLCFLLPVLLITRLNYPTLAVSTCALFSPASHCAISPVCLHIILPSPSSSQFSPMFYWFLVSGYALFSPVTAVDIGGFFFRFLPIKALLFHCYSTKLYILHSALLFTPVHDNKGFNCGRCKSKSMINTTYQSFSLLTFVRSFSHVSWTAVAFSQ